MSIFKSPFKNITIHNEYYNYNRCYCLIKMIENEKIINEIINTQEKEKYEKLKQQIINIKLIKIGGYYNNIYYHLMDTIQNHNNEIAFIGVNMMTI